MWTRSGKWFDRPIQITTLSGNTENRNILNGPPWGPRGQHDRPQGVNHMHLPTLWTWLNAKFHMGEYDDERGANLVEYILLIVFIALIVLIAVKVLGRTVSTKFSSADTGLQP